MCDIVGRLRKTHAEIVESDGGECDFIAMFREAADEIEQLQTYKRAQMEDIMNLGQMVGNREAEIERLRAALDDKCKHFNMVDAMWRGAEDENERLRAAITDKEG